MHPRVSEARSIEAPRAARSLGLFVLLAPIGAAAIGCEGAATETVSRSSTSTVAVGRAQLLVVDAVIPLRVVGERRFDEVRVELDLTVTASAADVAQRVADGYAPEVERDDRRSVVTIRIPPPSVGVLGGEVTLAAPLDLDLEARARAGTLEVSGMESDLLLRSAGSVRLVGAEGDVRVVVQSGNALVDHRLRAGDAVDVEVGSGDVQLDLPVPLDADVFAEGSGGVVSVHPDLPSRPAGAPLRFTAGGGSASVFATTERGTVFFAARRRD